MTQSVFPITPVEIVPGGAASWRDMDASSQAPSGSTGVVLHIVNTSGTEYDLGLRKNGSSDDRRLRLESGTHCWAMIGVDGSRVFQAFVGSVTAIDIYIVGYTKAGVTFLTNASPKSLGSINNWYDIPCSVQAPGAIGLIFEVVGSPTQDYDFGLRKKGSSDDRHGETRGHCCFGAVVGCDGSQVCQGYIKDTDVDFFLVGYITDGATLFTNALDRTITQVDAWRELAALPTDTKIGFIEANATGVLPTSLGLRKNGSAEDIYFDAHYHPWAFVECDANEVIEAKISYADIGLFVVGVSPEFTPAGGSQVVIIA